MQGIRPAPAKPVGAGHAREMVGRPLIAGMARSYEGFDIRCNAPWPIQKPFSDCLAPSRPATLLAPCPALESVVRLADLLRLLLLAAIWGASFLFMRVIAPVLGSMPTAFFRASLGALGLLAILLIMRVGWDFRGKFRQCLLLGVINAGLPSAMYCLAALVLPAGYSAILNATTPKKSAML